MKVVHVVILHMYKNRLESRTSQAEIFFASIGFTTKKICMEVFWVRAYNAVTSSHTRYKILPKSEACYLHLQGLLLRNQDATDK